MNRCKLMRILDEFRYELTRLYHFVLFDCFRVRETEMTQCKLMRILNEFRYELSRLYHFVSLVCFRVREHLKTLADGCDPMQIDANFWHFPIRIDTFVSFRVICLPREHLKTFADGYRQWPDANWCEFWTFSDTNWHVCIISYRLWLFAFGLESIWRL